MTEAGTSSAEKKLIKTVEQLNEKSEKQLSSMQSSVDKADLIAKEIADLEAKRAELELQRKNIKDAVDKAKEDTKKALEDYNNTKTKAEKAQQEA